MLEHQPDASIERFRHSGERVGVSGIRRAGEIAEHYEHDGRIFRSQRGILRRSIDFNARGRQKHLGPRRNFHQLLEIIHLRDFGLRYPFQPGPKRRLHLVERRAARQISEALVQRDDRRLGHRDDSFGNLLFEQRLRRHSARSRFTREQLVRDHRVQDTAPVVVQLTGQSEVTRRIATLPLAIHLGERDDAIADLRGRLAARDGNRRRHGRRRRVAG